MTEIVESQGFDGVVALCTHTKDSACVGDVLAQLTSDRFADAIVPKLLEADDPRSCFRQRLRLKAFRDGRACMV